MKKIQIAATNNSGENTHNQGQWMIPESFNSIRIMVIENADIFMVKLI
jgi:hypothetical protein